MVRGSEKCADDVFTLPFLSEQVPAVMKKGFLHNGHGWGFKEFTFSPRDIWTDNYETMKKHAL